MVHEYFICFTATWQEFIVHWETNKVLLIRMSSKRANLEKKTLTVLIVVNIFWFYRKRSKKNLTTTSTSWWQKSFLTKG